MSILNAVTAAIQPRRPTFKYLSGEGKRNRANADLFQALLCLAWGDDCQVITGHHVSFLFNGDLSTEDEVPSADSLLFDHDVMKTVFPADYLAIMAHIAVLPRYDREDFVRTIVCHRFPESGLSPESAKRPN